MPNFDGLKMLQVVKLLDELKNIPVIVISANTDKTNVFSAIEAGADKVLAKPLKKDLLISTVENVLGKSLTLELNNNAISTLKNDDELTEQLKKLFVDNFKKEKYSLNAALQKKEPAILRQFAHNAKAVGQSIGYPQLQKITSEVELLLNENEINWQIIKIKYNQVFAVVKDIENSLLVWES